MSEIEDRDDDFSSEQFENLGQSLDSDQPEFDLVFQHGLLKISLQEDHFCSQLCRYLGQDKDLKEFRIFDNIPTEQIFEMLCKSMIKTGTRPSEGELRQLFTEFSQEEKERLNITLDQILNTQIPNPAFHKRYIGAFVQRCKMSKGMIKIQKSWKKDGGQAAPDEMQRVLDSIRQVDFEEQNIVTFEDFDSLYHERKTGQNSKIPTGITQLDDDLLGGLPTESLVIVLSGTNVGKSIFSISLAVQALKAKDEAGRNRGFKVLHVNLEGRRDEALFRYMANMAQVNLKAIAKGELNEAEAARIKQVKEEVGKRLVIRNMTGFGVTIEDLVAYTREIYKEFKFNMLVVDYGQLLETKQKTENHRLAQARVFRGLDSMSKEFKCVCVSPVQATRGAQENQNMNSFKNRGKGENDPRPVMRSNDISEAFEIARVAAIILSLNRTDEEVEQGKLRVFLEKQREGAKNTTYGVFTNYGMSDVITGKYYDPKATMMKEDEKVADKDTVSVADYDPEVTEADRIDTKIFEIDVLVNDYRGLLEKDSELVKGYNAENKKPDGEKNQDVLIQYLEDRQKIKKQMKEIFKKSTEAIKIIDPEASEEKLKMFEVSLKDVRKSGTENEINELERIVNRYRLALKGKL